MKKYSPESLALITVSVGLALSVSTQVLYAQISNELEVIEVVSTATRTEQPIEGVAASVIVIDSKEIRRMGAPIMCLMRRSINVWVQM